MAGDDTVVQPEERRTSRKWPTFRTIVGSWAFIAFVVLEVAWIGTRIFFPTQAAAIESAVRNINYNVLTTGKIEAGFALGVFALGTFLYGFRCRRPNLYGIVEILVGVSLATYILDQLRGHDSPAASGFFTAVGALYVIVRGYDNIYRSMRSEAQFTRHWNRVFFNQNTPGKLYHS